MGGICQNNNNSKWEGYAKITTMSLQENAQKHNNDLS